MTIDEAIALLTTLREEIGGDAVVLVYDTEDYARGVGTVEVFRPGLTLFDSAREIPEPATEYDGIDPADRDQHRLTHGAVVLNAFSE